MCKDKKKIRILLSFVLLMLLCIAVFFSANRQSAYAEPVEKWNDVAVPYSLLDADESNSPENPYIIDSAAKLAYLAVTVNSGELQAGTCFLQTANIDLAGRAFTPIGFDARPFTGSFDGGNYTISNIYINQPAVGISITNGLGLFGSVNTIGSNPNSGIIKRVKLNGGSVYTSRGTVDVKNMAALVGLFKGVLLTDCSANGVSVTLDGVGENIAGLIGSCSTNVTADCVISNCYFDGTVVALDADCVAGIIGTNGAAGAGVSKYTVESCFNAGTVMGKNTVSGIAATNYGSVTNAYNAGDVEGVAFVGGIIAVNDGGEASYGYNIGAVQASGGLSGSAIAYLRRGAALDLYYLNKTAEQSLTLDGIGVNDVGLNATYVRVNGKSYLELTNGLLSLPIAKWTALEREEAYGYTPCLKAFSEEFKTYGKTALYAGEVPTDWGSAEATPYIINEAEQYGFLRERVSNGFSYDGKYFKLATNLEFNNNYSSIGAEAAPFSGCFDGNDKILSEITIYPSSNGVGVFGYTDGAELKNIVLSRVVIYAEAYNYVGTLVGKASNTKITNVKAEADCVTNGGSYVGGLVGMMNVNADNIEIADCENRGKINGVYSVGGIVGAIISDKSVSVSGVINFGTVTAGQDEGTSAVGGLIGHTDGIVTVTSSYAKAKVTASGDYAGGILGSLSSVGTVNVSSCFVHNSVTGINYVGGLIGHCGGEYTVLESYVVGSIAARTFVAGLVGFGENASSSIADAYFSGSLNGSGNTVSGGAGTVQASVYYNSDFVYVSGTIVSNGTGKTSIELTDLDFGTLRFSNKANADSYGFYPQLTTFAETADSLLSVRFSYFASGTGTDVTPYIITNEVQLVCLQRFVNSGYNSDFYINKSYALSNNITITRGFEPISSRTKPFSGKLNGRNYAIYGLLIDKSGEDDVGLFRATANGSLISNLHLLPIASGDSFIGSVDGRSNVGGIVGYAEGRIVFCSNRLSVSGTSSNVGGIAGYSAKSIENSFNTGNVVGSVAVGGIVGYSSSGVMYGYNSGYISATSEKCGGIAGNGNSVAIVYCYNSGTIGGIGVEKGGIIGYGDGHVEIHDCYNIGTFADNVNAGALVGKYLGTTNIYNLYFNSDLITAPIIAEGNTEMFTNSMGKVTADMVDSSSLNNTNMYFSQQGIFIATSGRSDVASYAPQLKAFVNFSVGEFENPEAEALIKEYSRNSVMLRLYGITPESLADWGSAANPYLIDNYSQFVTFTEQVNGGYSYAGKHFKLMTNLALNSEFNGIGKFYSAGNINNRSFGGTFDGNGKTVSNLNLDFSTAEYSVGFFGYISVGSVVKDIVIADGTVRGKSKVGTIVGFSEGLISGCLSYAKVIGDESVGGIVGEIRALLPRQIEACLYQGEMIGNVLASRGGIVGKVTGTTEIYNSWYVLTIASGSNYQGNILAGTFYVDKNGSALGSIDYTPGVSADEKVLITITPSDGFGFAIKDTNNFKVNFSDDCVGGICYPIKAVGYNGLSVIWRLRFTKAVTVGTVTNGVAVGGGNYFEGEEVSVTITPKMGYVVILENEYNYVGDGDNIVCTWSMGGSDFVFTAECALFGTNANEIVNANNESVVTTVEGGETVTPYEIYSYNGENKEYTIALLGDYSPDAAYFRVESGGVEAVTEIKNANVYRLVIRAAQSWKGNTVLVGKKVLNFEIKPVQLSVNVEALVSDDSYTKKEYDKNHTDSITISTADIIGLCEGDEISLIGERTFYLGSEKDSSVSDNKTVRFLNFFIDGTARSNYLAPSDVSLYNGEVILGIIAKRTATVIVSSSVLTKQFDGEIPLIGTQEIKNEMSGDNIKVSEFNFIKVDEEGNAITDDGTWSIGRYRIEIKTVTGEKQNYEIGIEEAYYVITSKVISSVTFTGTDGLRYSGTDYANTIQARFLFKTGVYQYAEVDFMSNNAQVTECINAGSYIATARLTDTNFVFDSSKSKSFVIEKISQAALVLSDISDTDYSTQTIELNTVGGNGDGSVFFEVIEGKANVAGNVLRIIGAGKISVQATKNASTNYNRIQSNTVMFNVSKSVLTATVVNSSVEYGETPEIEIVYAGYVRGENGDKSKIAGLIEPSVIIMEEDLCASETGYEVFLQDNGSADGYVINVTNAVGRLTVTRKSVRVDATNVSKVYGDADPVFSYEVIGESIVLAGAPTRVRGENVGNYLIGQGTMTEELNPNYNIVFIPANLEITPRTLNVSINSAKKNYGANEPAYNFNVSDEELQFGDTSSIVTGTISRDAGETVGKYTLRCANVSAGNNYTVSLALGNLTINQAVPEIRSFPIASAISYGDALSESEIVGEMNVDGAFSWVNGSIIPSVINSNLTYYQARFVPLDTVNYSSITLNLQLTVNKRRLVVAFEGMRYYSYDGSDKKLIGASARNLLENDSVDVMLTYSSEMLVDVGMYSVTASINDDNYYLDTQNNAHILNIEIAQSQVIVSAISTTIVDGDEFVPHVTYDGFKGLDGEEVLSEKVKFRYGAEFAPGTVVDIIPYGAEAKNYRFVYEKAKLTIEPRMIKEDEITLSGNTLISGLKVTLTRVEEKESTSYASLATFIEERLDGQIQNDLTLDKYTAINLSSPVSGDVTYTLKFDKPEDGATLVLHKTDGTVSLLTDYEYNNGELTFTASDVMGVGTLREKTVFEKYKKYVVYVGIGLGVFIIFGIAITCAVYGARKRKRRTPNYKD